MIKVVLEIPYQATVEEDASPALDYTSYTLIELRAGCDTSEVISLEMVGGPDRDKTGISVRLDKEHARILGHALIQAASKVPG